MPVVTFHNEHRAIEVEPGTNLRQLMLKVGVTPYQGITMLTNCRGHNFCGTCAVEVVDGKGATPRGQDEEATLGGNLLIAKEVGKNVRLSCQTDVVSDMVVKTHPVVPIDKQKTRERFTLLGISSFFLLAFLAIFVFLFLDMIKKF
ncbi:MAG: (2Fe-2S)-binding protein [Ignavibacteria bacterium]|nr:(2Fe-2S)-binding protein [Ignavibacteria bacterium]